MTYRVIEEVELKVLNRTKLFKKDVEYKWDVFIKTYPNKFINSNASVGPELINIDCGNSVLEEDVLNLDFNNTFV